MSSDASVTYWIQEYQGGNRRAAQELWERYFQRLVRLARQKLPGRALRVADEEDVALSAFHSFCRGVEAGRYPQLADRDDLWRLLVVITAHKAVHVVRDAQRLKRGGPPEGPRALDAEQAAISQVIGPEPTPQFAATYQCGVGSGLQSRWPVPGVRMWGWIGPCVGSGDRDVHRPGVAAPGR